MEEEEEMTEYEKELEERNLVRLPSGDVIDKDVYRDNEIDRVREEKEEQNALLGIKYLESEKEKRKLSEEEEKDLADLKRDFFAPAETEVEMENPIGEKVDKPVENGRGDA